jgi:hypothetical protein
MTLLSTNRIDSIIESCTHPYHSELFEWYQIQSIEVIKFGLILPQFYRYKISNANSARLEVNTELI